MAIINKLRYVTVGLIISLMLLNCVIITKWLYVAECSLKSTESSLVIVHNAHRNDAAAAAAAVAAAAAAGRPSSVAGTTAAAAAVSKSQTVQNINNQLNLSLAYDFISSLRNQTAQSTLIDFLHEFTPSLPDDFDFNTRYWQFALQISNTGLYSEKNGHFIDKMLESMSTSELVDLEAGVRGTQLKFFATTADGAKTILKLRKVKRDYVVPPDLFYFSEFERHFAEIAAYHLDRVLGFNRVPPCVGRMLNITGEIEPFADDNMRKTIFTSPAGNRCLYGQCRYFCDTPHSVCGSPDLIEASMCILLPYSTFSRRLIRSPWRRSYSKFGTADWELPENNRSYCRTAKETDRLLKSTSWLLSVTDLYIFDFLTGNQDRHHYDAFESFDSRGAVVAIDNGRGFGRPYKDDFSILAPLYQCCQIRQSTYRKLSFFAQSGVPLSALVQASLAKDPLHRIEPILTKAHLDALDRRVQLILDTVHNDCMINKKLPAKKVIIDDGL